MASRTTSRSPAFTASPGATQFKPARKGPIWSGQKVSQSSFFDGAGLATGIGLVASFAANDGTVGAVAILVCEGLKAGARGADRKAGPEPALSAIGPLASSAARVDPSGEAAALLPSLNTATV